MNNLLLITVLIWLPLTVVEATESEPTSNDTTVPGGMTVHDPTNPPPGNAGKTTKKYPFSFRSRVVTGILAYEYQYENNEFSSANYKLNESMPFLGLGATVGLDVLDRWLFGKSSLDFYTQQTDTSEKNIFRTDPSPLNMRTPVLLVRIMPSFLIMKWIICGTIWWFSSDTKWVKPILTET